MGRIIIAFPGTLPAYIVVDVYFFLLILRFSVCAMRASALPHPGIRHFGRVGHERSVSRTPYYVFIPKILFLIEFKLFFLAADCGNLSLLEPRLCLKLISNYAQLAGSPQNAIRRVGVTSLVVIGRKRVIILRENGNLQNQFRVLGPAFRTQGEVMHPRVHPVTHR
jgi:hypothetical protein